MKPTTAVIFAAGTGTRMLPVTAAVQKELLPILNRPVIDYVVADCVAAGITRIVFVIRPGQTGLKDFYLGNPDYEQALERLGKTNAIDGLKAIQNQAKFEFVEQSDSAGYGTAIALQAALPLLKGSETVLVCGGEDFIWHPDGSGETPAFVEAFAASKAAGAIMALELPEDQLHEYGVLATQTKEGSEYLKAIIEKPATGQAPSRLANISKYILSGPFLEAISAVQPRPEVGESYIVDGIMAAAANHPMLVHQTSGTYLDTGNPKSWLEANQIVAKKVFTSTE